MSTGDSLRSDESMSGSERFTFLCPRDPSILSYHQRPKIDPNCGTKLESMLEEVDDIPPAKTVKVYLRMKPFPTNQIFTDEQLDAYRIINKTSLLTKLPNIENVSSKKNKQLEFVTKKYIFTQTFGPETSQLTIFEEAVKPHMAEFLKGEKNSVIMSYGTTNSGKSYTLRGKTSSPGIIPRGLEFVFSNITGTLPNFRPINHSDVEFLSDAKVLQEIQLKESLLAFNCQDKTKYDRIYKEMQKTLHDETTFSMSLDSTAQYSVWVSFAEIYNETVYDLLASDCQSQKKPLKLATDSKGRLYVRDLRLVNVSCATEAYQIFMYGQYNLKIAATALNSRSSRSHCIFTIKLLKYEPGCSADEVDVSTFSFCDLAGSERLNKTLNVGDRVKEAQNINTSLLVLSRCLKAIYEHQSLNETSKKKSGITGPFRESKLTRLFQNALSGQEHIALIVNINPIPNLYVETQNVLKFSAIAKRIIQEQPKPVVKSLRTRFSLVIAQSRKTETDWDATTGTNVSEGFDNEDSQCMYIDETEYLELIRENKELKTQVASFSRELMKRDMETRQELTEMYKEMMRKLEHDYKNRLEEQEADHADYMRWREEQMEEHFKEQLEIAMNNRRSSIMISNEEGFVSAEAYKKIELNNEQLEAKVEDLKATLRSRQEAFEMLKKEAEAKKFEAKTLETELRRCKQLLDAQDNEKELRAQLADSEERNKNLKQLLNDAKKEYLVLSESEQLQQNKLAAQADKLQANHDLISDLEEQLEMATACCAEKNSLIESYETSMEQQNKEILQRQIRVDAMLAEMQTQEEVIGKLCDENEHLKKLVDEQQHQLHILQDVGVPETERRDFEQQTDLTEKEKVEQMEVGCQGSISEDDFCGQTSFVEENNVEELKQEIDDLKKELEKNTQIIKERNEHIESMNQELKTLMDSTVCKDSLNEKMEQELKRTLRELTSAKESTDRSRQKEQELLKNFEYSRTEMKTLQASKDSLIRENERLKITIEKLEKEVAQAARERESMIKNNEKVLKKYEDLVDARNSEITNLKEEMAKVQSKNAMVKEKDKKHLPIKDETSDDEGPQRSAPLRRKIARRKDLVEITSDDETVPKRRMTRLAGKKELAPVTPSSTTGDDVNIVEISSTEQHKKSNKKNSFVQPRSTEVKRTRRKQLYFEDDMVELDKNQETVDLCESIAATPPTHNTRSLRKRKK